MLTDRFLWFICTRNFQCVNSEIFDKILIKLFWKPVIYGHGISMQIFIVLLRPERDESFRIAPKKDS